MISILPTHVRSLVSLPVAGLRMNSVGDLRWVPGVPPSRLVATPDAAREETLGSGLKELR